MWVVEEVVEVSVVSVEEVEVSVVSVVVTRSLHVQMVSLDLAPFSL